jgi:hypothetical protein
MKKYSKAITFALFLIVGIAAGIWIARKIDKKVESRIKTTVENAINQYGQSITNEARSVVKSELKGLYPHVDSLAAASGIKIRKIERTTIIDHQVKYDTVPVILTPDTSDNRIVNMTANYKCLEAKGIIDFTKTSLTLTNDDVNKMRVTLTDVKVTDKLTTLYYFDRESKKILFFRLKIGRKHYYSETNSSCNAETKTETINLIKK